MIVRRIGALLLIAGSIALVAVGCEGGQVVPSPTGAIVEPTVETSPTDDTTGDGQDPPTLAPVAPGVKAGPKCDAAFKAWVTWWVAEIGPDASVDPSADPAEAPSVAPSGDPNVLEHTVFNACTLAELGAANVAHPVILVSDGSPAPYIEYEIGWYVAGECADPATAIGDTKLCKAVPSPSP